ncbi:MAG: radical SAM protein [Pseudomonadota bacterium]
MTPAGPGRARSLAKALLLRARVPLSVTVEVTNRCNIKCRYCDPRRPGEAEMSTGQILGLLDEFRAMGTQRVGFTGGEPTLREDLPALLAHARRLGLVATVSTNGRLVAERIETLRDASVIMVSLDGPPEVHDMRGRGTYERSVAAIRALRRQGVKVFSSTVITRASAHQIDHVLDLARAVGFSCIFALLFSEHHRSVPPAEHVQLAASDEDSRDAYRLLLARKRAGAPIVNSEAFLRYMAEARYVDRPIRCKAAQWYCAVGSDGTLATCGLHLGEPGLPNGIELGFARAFQALRKAPCDRAYCNFGVEQSMTLSLHPGAVLNFARYIGRL